MGKDLFVIFFQFAFPSIDTIQLQSWQILYKFFFSRKSRNLQFYGKSYVLSYVDKNELGNILGDFFTNQSGHNVQITSFLFDWIDKQFILKWCLKKPLYHFPTAYPPRWNSKKLTELCCKTFISSFIYFATTLRNRFVGIFIRISQKRSLAAVLNGLSDCFYTTYFIMRNSLVSQIGIS
jgi:hypothetical protein